MMSNTMTMSICCNLAEGKTEADFRLAMAPLYDYIGADGSSLYEYGLEVNDLEIYLHAYGDVSCGFEDLLGDCAKNLGPIVAVGGHIHYQNLDSGSDEPVNWFWFGPNDREILEARIEVGLDRLCYILGELSAPAVQALQAQLLETLSASISQASVV